MSHAPRDIARGVPVVGFVGANGSGKTLRAVESCLADMVTGRPVYSTVAINSELGSSLPIRSMSDLLSITDATVLVDEVTTVFSSRTSTSIPPEFDVWLKTLRHKEIRLLWTAPAWGRAENRLRDVTQACVTLHPLLRRRVAPSPWPMTVAGYAGLLSTVDLAAADDAPTRTLRRSFFWSSASPAWGSYDTHAPTPALVASDLGGVCPDCGGSRARPKCSADRHAEFGLPDVRVSALLSGS